MLNEQHRDARPGDDRLNARIRSYELAGRMQMTAPGLLEIDDEPEHIQAMYGIGKKPTDNFGRQCLMARRLCEAGVRFVQVNYGDNSNNPRWDQHSNLEKHAEHAMNTDQPVAGLIADLKQRGLLEDTLIVCGGEFGRTPFREGRTAKGNVLGRDHYPDCFTMWMAGGGVKGGFNYGQTDELGFGVTENKVHVHDLLFGLTVKSDLS